jgi:hypothetical protein
MNTACVLQSPRFVEGFSCVDLGAIRMVTSVTNSAASGGRQVIPGDAVTKLPLDGSKKGAVVEVGVFEAPDVSAASTVNAAAVWRGRRARGVGGLQPASNAAAVITMSPVTICAFRRRSIL